MEHARVLITGMPCNSQSLHDAVEQSPALFSSVAGALETLGPVLSEFSYLQV
jgi:hypothetical protein